MVAVRGPQRRSPGDGPQPGLEAGSPSPVCQNAYDEGLGSTDCKRRPTAVLSPLRRRSIQGNDDGNSPPHAAGPQAQGAPLPEMRDQTEQSAAPLQGLQRRPERQTLGPRLGADLHSSRRRCWASRGGLSAFCGTPAAFCSCSRRAWLHRVNFMRRYPNRYGGAMEANFGTILADSCRRGNRRCKIFPEGRRSSPTGA